MTDEEVAAKIAEAVKAAEEAQSERIIALLTDNTSMKR